MRHISLKGLIRICLFLIIVPISQTHAADDTIYIGKKVGYIGQFCLIKEEALAIAKAFSTRDFAKGSRLFNQSKLCGMMKLAITPHKLLGTFELEGGSVYFVLAKVIHGGKVYLFTSDTVLVGEPI